MKDSNLRSIVKGITWRIVGTVDTIILSYIILGNMNKALLIGFTEVATKIFLYYLHERLWNAVTWGRRKKRVAHLRSLAKGVSWRFVGSLDTILLAWIYSGNPLGAIKVGLSELLTKVTLFYLHERLWSVIKWGRIFKESMLVTADGKNSVSQKD